MATRQEIIDAAIVIKNETVNKANTALRVGTILEDLAIKLPTYKSYFAGLSQNGGAVPPTVNYSETDFVDTPILSYNVFPGTYRLTSAGAFPDEFKISVVFGVSELPVLLEWTYLDANTIGILAKDPVSELPADGLIRNNSIEIRVYE